MSGCRHNPTQWYLVTGSETKSHCANCGKLIVCEQEHFNWVEVAAPPSTEVE
jgi:hypothetical protein